MELGVKAHSRAKSKVYMTGDVKDDKFNIMVKYICFCILGMSHHRIGAHYIMNVHLNIYNNL